MSVCYWEFEGGPARTMGAAPQASVCIYTRQYLDSGIGHKQAEDAFPVMHSRALVAVASR